METRYQRLAREQAERQAARAKRVELDRKKQRQTYWKTRKAAENLEYKTADRVDGYDRDDLGESPDY